jgi:prepilin-type processing-associated H-X9-DG protein
MDIPGHGFGELSSPPPELNPAPASGTHRQNPLDTPATYHGFLGNLSFADGHGESHRWRASSPGGGVDWVWVQQHTTELQ